VSQINISVQINEKPILFQLSAEPDQSSVVYQ